MHPYLNPEEPGHPYSSVLFDQGVGFLVDDSQWENNEELQVLRPFNFAE